jgi:hypothetical protein
VIERERARGESWRETTQKRVRERGEGMRIGERCKRMNNREEEGGDEKE